MQHGSIEDVVAELVKLSNEVKQLRVLINAEVIRADDMPILPVFQRDRSVIPFFQRQAQFEPGSDESHSCFKRRDKHTEAASSAEHTEGGEDTRIEITSRQSVAHQAASDIVHQPPATRPPRCALTSEC
jgi:hypothetical protein